MNYKIGRDNFALTIFMPVDCKNGCSFCTSKKDYQINKPDFGKVFNAIDTIAHYNIPFSDIVIPVCSLQEEYCSDRVGIEWSCCEWS